MCVCGFVRWPERKTCSDSVLEILVVSVRACLIDLLHTARTQHSSLGGRVRSRVLGWLDGGGGGGGFGNRLCVPVTVDVDEWDEGKQETVFEDGCGDWR